MAEAVYDEYVEFYDDFVSSQYYVEYLMPLLWEMIPPVAGSRVCDVACGQGIVARGLAERGASVTGVDISMGLLERARTYERDNPLGIRYVHDDAQDLRLVTGPFDGAVCNLALMDIPDLEGVLRSVRRILAIDGWFVFSITHPCWEAPFATWSSEGDVPVRIVRQYLTEGFWRATHNPQGIRYRVGAWHRTMATYINALANAGFRVERMLEPPATGTRLEVVPGNAEMPSNLFVRAATI